MLTLIFLMLCLASPARAAMTIFMSPDGDGRFILEGDNVGNARFIEVKVEYDPALLSAPQVTLQGGSLAEVYDGTPGTLLFRADRGESPGCSFEAHLEFTRQSEGGGGIYSVTGSTRDEEGKDTPADTLSNLGPPAPPGPDANAAAGTVQVSAGGTPRESAGEVLGGGASLPEATPVGPEVIPECTPVLRRFEEFRGTPGLTQFAALFQPCDQGSVQQDPPVLLADGKKELRVRLRLGTRGAAAPGVALRGAKLVSVLREGECWVVTALPDASALQATLFLESDDDTRQIPLVVAPPIALPEGVKEGTFLESLRSYQQKGEEKGAANSTATAVSAYTFTANFLARFAAARASR